MTFDVALVLPAFNEERRLPQALDRLARFAREASFDLQVVVADDGSTDDTPRIARLRDEQTRGDPHFRVVHLPLEHRGKGAAVRAGMSVADAPFVGYCDVDLSAGEDAIGLVHRAAKGGADMAMGSRGLPDSVLVIRQARYRELAGKTFNLMLRRLARVPYRDTQCGLKIFRREAADEIFRRQRLDGFAFDAELVVIAMTLGYGIEEVPIRWTNSPGSRVSLLHDSIRMARDIVRIVRRLGRQTIHPPGIPTDAAMARMTSAEDRHWWHVAKRELVKSLLGPTGGAALDIGCGGGALLTELEGGRNAFGVDLSTRALGHARTRGLPRLAHAEATHLPFRDGAFSAALALDVIEHHPRPERLVAEAARVLQEDGLIVVTAPAFSWMWSYADEVLGHYRRYTKETLRREIEAAGFEIVRLTYFHSWLLPLAWGFRKARKALRRTATADDFEVPTWLNNLLLRITRAERRLVLRRDLPFGLSVLGVARRRA